MAITISPLQREDIPTFVRIELAAFRPHPRIPILWPRGYTDDLYSYYEDNKNESLDDPECRFIKAVDDATGEIIAVSEWTFSLDVEKQREKEATDPNATPPGNWPRDGNWELKRLFRLNTEKWQREWLDGEPFIELEILVTNPAFQSRGAGSKLLSWGVEQADRIGVPMALESTPAGLALYKRFGFVEKDVIKADMRQFGWEKPYDPEAAKRVWMIREPKTKEPVNGGLKVAGQ